MKKIDESAKVRKGIIRGKRHITDKQEQLEEIKDQRKKSKKRINYKRKKGIAR